MVENGRFYSRANLALTFGELSKTAAILDYFCVEYGKFDVFITGEIDCGGQIGSR